MTQLVIRSNRLGPDSMLGVDATTVPADAAIAEFFTLPPGYGDLLIAGVSIGISAMSGAYVAPAPADDGPWISITDFANGATVDFIGDKRWVHASTSAARPSLFATIELYRRKIFQQNERLYVFAPIMAGAGVTLTVQCRVYGQRINTA